MPMGFVFTRTTPDQSSLTFSVTPGLPVTIEIYNHGSYLYMDLSCKTCGLTRPGIQEPPLGDGMLTLGPCRRCGDEDLMGLDIFVDKFTEETFSLAMEKLFRGFLRVDPLLATFMGAQVQGQLQGKFLRPVKALHFEVEVPENVH